MFLLSYLLKIYICKPYQFFYKALLITTNLIWYMWHFWIYTHKVRRHWGYPTWFPSRIHTTTGSKSQNCPKRVYWQASTLVNVSKVGAGGVRPRGESHRIASEPSDLTFEEPKMPHVLYNLPYEKDFWPFNYGNDFTNLSVGTHKKNFCTPV